MSQTPATDLDAFEAALLAELRAAVATPAVPAPTRLSEPRLTDGRRPWLVAVIGVAAAALAVAVVLPSLRPTPAYAVSERSNGEVTVQVNRLEGAEDLERALRERGIPADVTYLPDGQKCASDRYNDVSSSGLSLTVSSTTFKVTIPANSVGADDTFVLSAAVVPLPNGVRAAVDFGVASGPVLPCASVDAN